MLSKFQGLFFTKLLIKWYFLSIKQPKRAVKPCILWYQEIQSTANLSLCSIFRKSFPFEKFVILLQRKRRNGRVVECGGLENRCPATAGPGVRIPLSPHLYSRRYMNKFHCTSFIFTRTEGMDGVRNPKGSRAACDCGQCGRGNFAVGVITSGM